jgi:hypothetical protein
VDVGVVCEQAFLRGVEEVGAVVDAGLFAGGAAEDLGAPGVAVFLGMVSFVYEVLLFAFF